jgi:hypothetical protein
MARSVLQDMPAISAKPPAHPTYNTPQGVKLIRYLIGQGFPAHRIAALFDINQGRINEVKKGKDGHRFRRHSNQDLRDE